MGRGLVIISLFIIPSVQAFRRHTRDCRATVGCVWLSSLSLSSSPSCISSAAGSSEAERAQARRTCASGGWAGRRGVKDASAGSLPCISRLPPSGPEAARLRHGAPGHSIPGALDIAACQFMLRGWWHGRRAAITDEQDNLLPGQLVQAGANVGAPAGADNLLGEGGTGLDGRGKGLPCG